MILTLCEKLWGECEYNDLPLRVIELEDAIYIPWNAEGTWGIFDKNGDLVRSALDRGGNQTAVDPKLPIYKVVPGEMIYFGLLDLHYGHFLINTLSRFWPIFLHDKLPDILCHGPFTKKSDFSTFHFLSAIFREMNISPNDISFFATPVRIEKLLIPESAISEQKHITGTYLRMCKKIGIPHWDSDQIDVDQRPIFLSKIRLNQGVGKIDEEQLIVDEMQKQGVRIVYPERLTFREQVELLSRSRFIMGMSGSALHTSIFGAMGRNIVAINVIPDVNSNLALIDIANKNNARYFYAEGTTHSHGQQGFLTVHSVPNPRQVAKELLALL